MAFRVWEELPDTGLPRVICYFNITWPEQAYLNEYPGELCAIREYPQWSSQNRFFGFS